MTDIGADIGALYDTQLSEYYAYVAIARGDNLVSSQVISPRKVAAARRDWTEALARLRAAGGTPDVVREMLRERAAESSTTTRRRRVA